MGKYQLKVQHILKPQMLILKILHPQVVKIKEIYPRSMYICQPISLGNMSSLVTRSELRIWTGFFRQSAYGPNVFIMEIFCQPTLVLVLSTYMYSCMYFVARYMSFFVNQQFWSCFSDRELNKMNICSLHIQLTKPLQIPNMISWQELDALTQQQTRKYAVGVHTS